MRWPALALLLVLLPLLTAPQLMPSSPPPPTAEHQSLTEDQQKKAAHETREREPPTSSTTAIQDTPREPRNEKPTHKEHRTDRPWYKDPNWFIFGASAIYALVAIGQLVAIRGQAKTATEQLAEMRRQADSATGQLASMKEQADVARDAADAAKKTADHLRATERPFLLLQSEGWPWGWPNTIEAFRDTPHRVIVPWKLTNHGNTPGWVTGMGVRLELRSWPLPAVPVAVPLEAVHNMPITRIKSHDHPEHLPMSGDDWNAVSPGLEGDPLCLVFYGLVKYRDAFGATHTTRFCETWRWARIRDEAGTSVEFRHEYMPSGPTPAWTASD